MSPSKVSDQMALKWCGTFQLAWSLPLLVKKRFAHNVSGTQSTDAGAGG
jgi:hypothetical protein